MTRGVTESHNGYVIEQVRRRLAAYAAREMANDGWPRAGGLGPGDGEGGGRPVVLTERPARRESEEEIGLLREHVRIIGRLDELVTITNFHVSAFVGEIDAAALPYVWRPHAAEVARVLEVPLGHLLDGANLVEVPRQRDGQLVLVEGVRFGEEIIFGATWRLLRNFLDIVAHERHQTSPPEMRR